jgi:POT family proton-dependent oligopeptide transporter
MQAMLVLYMTGELVQPGRIEKVLGFATYRNVVEGATGTLTPLALATQTFGLYLALITFFPIIGGWIGDKLISRRAAVAGGALLMTCGHFALAFDETFLLALLLLVLGAGTLRGNLKPQIRALYAAGDRRLADAFQVYNFVVNFGAFIAPIASGAVAKYYGWHAGFAVAGFGMLIGLVWYLLGSRHLPADLPRGIAIKRAPLTASDKRNLIGLASIWPISVCFWTAQAQIWNVYNVWVRDHVDMQLGTFSVPIPWLQSIDGLAPALFIPLVVFWWRAQAKRGTEPDLFVKLAIGCLIFALGTALLAAAPLTAGADGRAPLAVPIAFHLVSNLGAVFYVPVVTALYAAKSPDTWRGTVLGLDTLSVSAASLISGPMGAWYETMDPSAFWSINVAIVGGAGAVMLAAAPFARRWFGEDEPVVATPLPA